MGGRSDDWWAKEEKFAYSYNPPVCLTTCRRLTYTFVYLWLLFSWKCISIRTVLCTHSLRHLACHLTCWLLHLACCRLCREPAPTSTPPPALPEVRKTFSTSTNGRQTLMNFLLMETSVALSRYINQESQPGVQPPHTASARQRLAASLASRRTGLPPFWFSTQELWTTVPPGDGSTCSRDTLFFTLARSVRRRVWRVKAYSSG